MLHTVSYLLAIQVDLALAVQSQHCLGQLLLREIQRAGYRARTRTAPNASHGPSEEAGTDPHAMTTHISNANHEHQCVRVVWGTGRSANARLCKTFAADPAQP